MPEEKSGFGFPYLEVPVYFRRVKEECKVSIVAAAAAVPKWVINANTVFSVVQLVEVPINGLEVCRSSIVACKQNDDLLELRDKEIAS